MSCFKILVFIIIAQSRGHHIYLQKELKVQNDGIPNILAHIQGNWPPFVQIETKSVIQKRESESEGEIMPLKVEIPAPVIENVQEKENMDVSSLFGFQRPEPGLSAVPLTRSTGPGLNTDIRESLRPVDPQRAVEFFEGLPPRPIEPIPLEPSFVPQPIPVPQRAGEYFAGLPPRPLEPIPLEPVAGEELAPILTPPPNNPVPEETPPPRLFDRTRVRQYAVYAGDVILKYLSQFFNRARLTFNRFTSPPPPTPVYEN